MKYCFGFAKIKVFVVKLGKGKEKICFLLKYLQSRVCNLKIF